MARICKGYVYVRYSEDKYELPIAVADTSLELDKILGNHPGTTLQSIARGRKTYAKVYIGEDAQAENAEK